MTRSRRRRRRLLDLFCCQGGAGEGYRLAGFDVFGVDIDPQPRNPHPFLCADAFDVLADRSFLADFDVIHASPPCQAYTPLGALHPHKTYPDLIDATREALRSWGGPWVIENVMTAPLLLDRSIVLCGEMFGLRTIRHRRFEPSGSIALTEPLHLPHTARTASSRRRERWNQGWHVSITGDVGVYVGPGAMAINWMDGNGLSEAIPPPYTRLVGRQILGQLAP